MRTGLQNTQDYQLYYVLYSICVNYVLIVFVLLRCMYQHNDGEEPAGEKPEERRRKRKREGKGRAEEEEMWSRVILVKLLIPPNCKVGTSCCITEAPKAHAVQLSRTAVVKQ